MSAHSPRPFPIAVLMILAPHLPTLAAELASPPRDLAPAMPQFVPATGACCEEFNCVIATASDCAAADGTYYGDGSTCDPNPCEPYGTCCDDIAGTCVSPVAYSSCVGRFLDFGACDAFWPPCGAMSGACCRSDGTCSFETYAECASGHALCPGDMNCDGVVDFADIDPFVVALWTPNGIGWAADCPWRNADVNGDFSVDFADIDPFVAAIDNSCPAASSPGVWLGGGTRCEACPIGIPIPPDAVPEAEPCGSDSNGGCGAPTPAFEPLDPNTTVHGTLWSTSSTADEDWYVFNVLGSEPRWVDWFVTAEMHVELALLQPDAQNCAVPIATTDAPSGEQAAVEAYLAPGTYYALVRPADPGDAPCGGQNDYVAFLAEDNAPKCEASINAGPRCLCKDQTEFWNAHWYPGGGTFKWAVTAGGNRLQLQGADNTPIGRAKGLALSEAVGDANLRFTYTTPAGQVCHGDRAITVIECAMSFRSNGEWNADNAVKRQKRVGNPKLGTITPGSPEGAEAWVKSMEIKGTISPCIAGLPCTYDFKREYKGRSGTIIPGKGWKAASDDSPNAWLDDDKHDDDEDLILDPPPKCTIFVIDTPGFVVGADCTQDEAGHILVQCINFREWLNVDLRRCTSYLEWHASTRIRCNPNNRKWEAENGGQGNSLGEGTITCGTTLADADAPRIDFNGNWALAARAIGSKDTFERLAADEVLRAAIEAGALSPAEIKLIIGELLPRTYEDGAQVWSTPMLALELLGQLHATEVVGPALDRLLEQFPRSVVYRRDVVVTPAAKALAHVGPAAVAEIARRAATMTDKEWTMAHRALRGMPDEMGMLAAIRDARAATTDPLVQTRMDEVLLTPRTR